MSAWYYRKCADSYEPAIIAREHEIRRRRWGWTFVAGVSAARLDGLLGLAASVDCMRMFRLFGLFLGMVGGWVAGAVDPWPRNDPRQRSRPGDGIDIPGFFEEGPDGEDKHG